MPKEYSDRYASIQDEKRRAYAGMITALDDQVGRVVAALEQKGLRDNTIILFASDNGGATNALFATGARSAEDRKESGGVGLGEKPPASNGRFRAGKGSLYEGGVRVPAFVNWPGKLKPAVVNEPVHMVDVMPTLLALAGGKGADGSSVRRQGHLADAGRRASPLPTRRSSSTSRPSGAPSARATGSSCAWPRSRARPSSTTSPTTRRRRTTSPISIPRSSAS